MDESGRPHRHDRRPRRTWRGTLVMVSVVGAVLGGGVWGSLALGASRRSAVLATKDAEFHRSATDLSNSVATALRRHTDLIASGATTIGLDEDMTNAEFQRWFLAFARARYPGLITFGYVERVRDEKLGAFANARRLDPVPVAEPFLGVVPPGARPQYCLIRLSAAGDATVALQLPAGLDLCTIPVIAKAFAEVESSGGFALFSMRPSGERSSPTSREVTLSKEAADALGTAYAIAAPVFSGRPVTAAERHEQLLGWVVAPFAGPQLVEAVLGDNDDVGIRLSWEGAGGDLVVVASRDAVARDEDAVMTHTSHVDADGKWTIRLTKADASAVASAQAQRRAVTGAGSAMSTLLAILLWVLMSARDRALRLIDRKTEELRHHALHDGLTNLPNRSLVLDRAEQMLAFARREGGAVAALFVDLDNFKNVNDTFGHAAGDALLRAVAARFAAALRESDTVGRFGGDEFVVLAMCDAVGDATLVAQRLLDTLTEPFELPGSASASTPLNVTASIGIAAGDRATPGDLLRDADVALYRAKAAGRAQYVLFESAMQAVVQDRLELEMDLYGAIDQGQLRLEYQPTFDLASSMVTGVEALLRWDHPTRGTVPPAQFIPLAEESALIDRIGTWVLHEACAQLAEWHTLGEHLAVSVNVSARQLETDALVSDVRLALDASGLAPSSLVLEITESTLMRDPEATAGRLTALKALGVRIAIDDFGTGYSSLAYLQKFPVDELKIDRSFVAAMVESPEAAALVRTFVELGRTLHLQTVAEGIEADEQLERLRRAHCDAGQGFAFARPMRPEAVPGFLEARRVVAA